MGRVPRLSLLLAAGGVLVLLLLAAPARAAEVAGDDGRAAAIGHYRQAREHYDRAEYDESIRELLAAYAADPEPEFLYNLGKVQARAGRTAAALASFRRYLALSPGGDHAGQAQQRIQALLGQAGPAERPRRSRREDPGQAARHYEHARQQYIAGRYDDALSELGVSFDLESNPEVLYNLAKVNQKAGRVDAAIQSYRDYLVLAPHGRNAVRAREQLDALLRARAPADRPRAPLPPPQQMVRAPRPRWRLGAGAAALLAGLGLAGTGSWALVMDGRCVSPPPPPVVQCRTVYEGLGIGVGLTAVGGALALGGAVLLALPGRLEARAVPFFGGGALGLGVSGAF